MDQRLFVVNLDAKQAMDLEIVGGKGANLAILYQRKFRVPNAFILTTYAFELIFNDNEIGNLLLGIDQIDVENIQELESLSQKIKTCICQIDLSTNLRDLILKSYDQLVQQTEKANLHVAVRSSATAEDLPENSFAGQQDTYLHVTRENLIGKIQECWASLFTSRAISYRKKSHIDHRFLKLAVIIQEMICSEVSGVAFTANPISGLRDEVIIDSSYGLGEALVSGLVTPDHYEILMNQNPEIRVKTLGEKSIHIIGKDEGGTETIQTKDNQRKIEALSDELIVQLAKLAKDIEKSYNNQPQDLEWGFSKGKFYILQARPITTLFPIPNHGLNQTDLRCFVSFNAIQGFLEPFTPLGESTLRTSICSLIRKVGLNRTSTLQDDISSNPKRHHVIKSSANRLWIDVTGILTAPIGKYFGLSLADSNMGKILNHLNTPKNFPKKSIFSWGKTWLFFLLFSIPLLLRSIRNFIFPRYAKKLFNDKMNEYHRFVDQNFQEHENQTFTQCVNHFINVLCQLPIYLYKYGAPSVFPGVISLKIIEKMCKDPMDAIALTRAVESNPTTEMNLQLWKITLLIRENSSVLNLFENEPMENLLKIYQQKSFEKLIQVQLEKFFEIYGCRGIGEIDLGHERWSDRPELVLKQIQNYLKITNPDKAIYRIHEQSQQSAYEALTRIENQFKYPWIQRFFLNILFNRLKILFSLRECPKFDGAIRTFAKCRQALFQKVNFLSTKDDICFLYIEELQTLARDMDSKDDSKLSFWKDLILQRKTEYEKQKSWKRIPLVLLSNGRTFYDATTVSDQSIELNQGEYLGCPVSPGIYQGIVRIVDDPLNSQLQPGEILVCTATDPAWTSLFPIVGALVLEMGGMLQHGAIVSREYGLPAVVGVTNAKNIFHNGRRIEVNGSNGKIRILSD